MSSISSNFFNQAPIFLLGIFLYKSINGISGKLITIVGAISVSWLSLAFSLKALYSVPSSPFFWVAVGFLMALVVVAFKLELTCKPINRLGQLSYSIYLVHFAIIEGVEWSFIHANVDKHGLSAFFVALTSILALCWWSGVVFERTIEKAASRMGKSLVNVVSTQAQPA